MTQKMGTSGTFEPQKTCEIDLILTKETFFRQVVNENQLHIKKNPLIHEEIQSNQIS